MPIYQFNGTDQTGAPSQGTFEAPNEEQALAQLAQYGLNVLKVVPMDAPSSIAQSCSATRTRTTQSRKKQKKQERLKRRKKRQA